jgi:hypothetical protein
MRESQRKPVSNKKRGAMALAEAPATKANDTAERPHTATERPLPSLTGDRPHEDPTKEAGELTEELSIREVDTQNGPIFRHRDNPDIAVASEVIPPQHRENKSSNPLGWLFRRGGSNPTLPRPAAGVSDHNHSGELEKLRKDHALLEEDYGKICDLWQRQREANNRLDRSWKKTTSELTRIMQQGIIYKGDDNAIKGDWEHLLYRCGQWSKTYCAGKAQPAGMKREDGRRLAHMCPQAWNYLQSSRLRPLLVLNPEHEEGPVWAGSYGVHVQALQKLLRPCMDL